MCFYQNKTEIDCSISVDVLIIALKFYLFDRIVKRTKNIMTLENLDSSDLKYYGNEKENNRLSNMVALIDTSETQRKNLRAHALVYLLVAVTSLIFAGSYSVSFLCTIMFFSFILLFSKSSLLFTSSLKDCCKSVYLNSISRSDITFIIFVIILLQYTANL